MPIQRSHGKPSPQVVRPNEMPQFVPDPDPVPAGPSHRGPDGRFVKGNGIARKGGQARQQVASHLRSLGLGWLMGEPRAAELRSRGIRQLRAEQTWLASTVGAGVLDPLAASELRSAATKEVLGHLLLEAPKVGGDTPAASIALASRLLSDARNHRLTALEIAARGAAARQCNGGGRPRPDLSAIDVTGELAALERLLTENRTELNAAVPTAQDDQP